MRPPLHRARLLRDRRGVSAVEFGLIAPVMFLMLMGLYDLLYNSYAQALLDGEIQRAARNSAIQGGADRPDLIDASVVKMVKIIGPDATWTSERRNYSSYSAAKPEVINDRNRNGRLDAGDCFTDVNGNRTWDLDPTRAGQGGADDVTRYTVRISYPRLFPIALMIGWGDRQEVTSTTFLKNQPFKRQVLTTTEVCI